MGTRGESSPLIGGSNSSVGGSKASVSISSVGLSFPRRSKMDDELAIDYITQLNLIIEDINYAANQYWGNERFKFLSKITSFATSLTTDNGEDRASKATFTIEMNGYVIPNNIQKSLSNFDPKTFSSAIIICLFLKNSNLFAVISIELLE